MTRLSWRTVCAGLLMLIMSLVESQRILHKPGRHVCRQEKVVMTPVTRNKRVCVPVYQRDYLPCHQPHSGLCPHVRLVYRTVFRTVTEMLRRRQTFFSCCPGWSHRDVTHNTCSTPVCYPMCHHGGSCRLPNSCNCPDGWNGTSCLSDVDECHSSPCEQKCSNSDGSFRCECYQGYRLAVDGYSCILCLSCTDEFTKLQQDQKSLQKTVIRLEEHNALMMRNLTTLNKDLIKLTSLPRPSPTTTSTTTTPPHTEVKQTDKDIPEELDAYMSSISEQIAMLEERLDVCTCSPSSSSSRSRGMVRKMKPRWERRSRTSRRRLKRRMTPTSVKATTADREMLQTPMVTTTKKNYLLYRPPSK